MTAPAAFTVDALLFVEPKYGGLRKHLNRNLFGFYMPQLVDDDMHFSTRLFNATRPLVGSAAGQNMKNPCLVSFDIFCPSFGDGLIHERLSVCLSLNMMDMPKIARTSASRPSRQIPSQQGVRHQPHYRRQQHSLTPTNSKTHQRLLPPLRPHCKRKKFHVDLEVYKLVDSDTENVRALNARTA